ncbi:MAG: transglycosylase SLT domain-containing protein [Lewinella sp.]
MSKLLKCLCMAVILAMYTSAQANSISSSNDPDDRTASSISHRLAGLELPLSTPASDAHLQRKLKDYLGGGSHSTERMLGRANQYFPVFEYYLAKHNMPESLKYLAVAESMLVPGAVSSARAAGLWQLMPATARSMGLRVDGTVDERLDMYRSTEAAVVMLKDLHRQFGDWHLALAAYNCGPGRVRRAIRAAGGHTFYPKVKRFLPRESQQYVASYVAAAYTVNYYGDYGLTPADYLLEDSVASISVYRYISLSRLAKASGLSKRLVRKMNPSYVRGFVPRNKRGYRLRVPLEAKWDVQRYVWGRTNLVMLDENPDVASAQQVATDLGFHAQEWLLGCKSQNLRHQSSLVETYAAAQMNLLLLEAYEAVAMN